MSRENLEQFMKQVAESEDLQSRLSDEIAGDNLVALGAEHGWEFSIEDVQASTELSDAKMEAVAGGLDPVAGRPDLSNVTSKRDSGGAIVSRGIRGGD